MKSEDRLAQNWFIFNLFNSFNFIDFILVLFALCLFWTYTFFISNSIFEVNIRVAQHIFVFKVKSYLRQQELLSNFQNFNFKKFVLKTGSLQLLHFQSLCKINNFSNVTSVYPKYYCTQLSCAKKKVVEKFGFGELKIEKVKLFTQIPTKICCNNFFNVGDQLSSCLIFRPFLTLDT